MPRMSLEDILSSKTKSTVRITISDARQGRPYYRQAAAFPLTQMHVFQGVKAAKQTIVFSASARRVRLPLDYSGVSLHAGNNRAECFCLLLGLDSHT